MHTRYSKKSRRELQSDQYYYPSDKGLDYKIRQASELFNQYQNAKKNRNFIKANIFVSAP